MSAFSFSFHFVRLYRCGHFYFQHSDLLKQRGHQSTDLHWGEFHFDPNWTCSMTKTNALKTNIGWVSLVFPTLTVVRVILLQAINKCTSFQIQLSVVITEFLRTLGSIVSAHPYCGWNSHATSCIERANWTIISKAISITLRGFNDLGCLVTPIFLLMGHFHYRFSTLCEKKENLSSRILNFLQNAQSNSVHLTSSYGSAAVSNASLRVEICENLI